MTIFRQSPWRGLGATFGVLAVLALALAAPIHHVHAIERDLGGIAHPGHRGPAAAPEAHGDHARHRAPARPETATVHCPLCTLGKMAGLLLAPTLTLIQLPGLAQDIAFPVEAVAAVSLRQRGIAEPRGPPAGA